MALSTTIPSTLNKKNLVKFSPLTTTVSVRMLTHPKSTMRILCMLMYANVFEFGPRDFSA